LTLNTAASVLDPVTALIVYSGWNWFQMMLQPMLSLVRVLHCSACLTIPMSSLV